MAASKVLQFCLLISFMIFPTHALKVLLTDGKVNSESNSGFEYDTEINVCVDERGLRNYNGCAHYKTYTAGPNTTKVIVYIKSYSVMKETTLRKKYQDKRVSIAESLSVNNIELLYLGVHGFKQGYENLVGEFLLWTIQSNPELPHFQTSTIGEHRLNQIYRTPWGNLTKYQEDTEIFEGRLQEHLRNIHNDLCLTHLLSDDLFDAAESSADVDSE